MQAECPKCGKDFDPRGKSGIKKFCSPKCANARTMTQETREKISQSVRKHIAENGTVQDRMTVEEFELMVQKGRRTRDRKLLEQEFDSLSYDMMKRRVRLEQDEKCNNCGIGEWLSKPITLELEHKDGNHQNNSRENLEMICPNCHSQTETWRGRNKTGKARKPKVSDEEICRAFLETGNIRQALLHVGLAAKGSNYGRVKRCLTQHGIKYK